MDAIKFLKEQKRMCKYFETCADCPLGKENNTSEVFCDDFMLEFPEKTVKIVSDWSDNNQPITNGTKFLQVFGITIYDALATLNWTNDEYKEIK